MVTKISEEPAFRMMEVEGSTETMVTNFHPHGVIYEKTAV
jgi:hypothetical protein